MSRTLFHECDVCRRPTDVRRLRAVVWTLPRQFVCSFCYGELLTEYLANREGETEFSKQVKNGQTPLPF